MQRLAVLCLLGLLSVACTPAGDGGTTTVGESIAETTTTSVARPTTTTTFAADGFGGEVVVGQQDSIGSLNPFAPDFFAGRIAGNLVWATVYDIEPDDWERIPDRVTELPTDSGAIEVNDDGTMTVRYEVRSGARWSDGLPITGDDLAFTAEAMRDLAQRGVGSVDPVMATVVATRSVERVAFITFAQPTLAFEDALWIILPKHALDGVDLVSGTDGSDWPSGGPFVVESFERPDSVRFVRNEFYGKLDGDGERLPYLDAVTVVTPVEEGPIANEPVSPTPEFVARNLDVAVLARQPAEIERAAQADGSQVELVPSPLIEHLAFQFGGARDIANPTSGNDSVAYRRAVAHALDREGLIDETGVPWFGDTPGMLVPVGSSAWERYPFDPEAAAELVVDSFGDPESRTEPSALLTTTGNGDYRIRVGDALASRFEQIDVPYEPAYQDSVLFFGDTLDTGAFDIGMWAWVSEGGYASPIRLLELFDPSSEAEFSDVGSWSGPGADRFSEIAAELRTTIDPDRFSELVTEADEVLADDLPIIPLFHRAAAFAWWPDLVSGIVPNGSRSDITWNVELWQKPGE